MSFFPKTPLRWTQKPLQPSFSPKAERLDLANSQLMGETAAADKQERHSPESQRKRRDPSRKETHQSMEEPKTEAWQWKKVRHEQFKEGKNTCCRGTKNPQAMAAKDFLLDQVDGSIFFCCLSLHRSVCIQLDPSCQKASKTNSSNNRCKTSQRIHADKWKETDCNYKRALRR